MSPNQKDDSRRLVWITRGNEQHPAYLLEQVYNGKHQVQWLSTDRQEWVLASEIHFERLVTPSKKRPRSNMVEAAVVAARVTLSPYSSSTCTAKSAADNASNAQQLVQLLSSQEDSDVEVLLTIFPPTPPQGRRTSPRRSGLQTDENTSRMSPPRKRGHEVQPKTLFADTPKNDSKLPPITTTTTRTTSYSKDPELSSGEEEDSDEDGEFLVDLRSPNVATRAAKTKKETPTEQVDSSMTTCRRKSPRLACPLYNSSWQSNETKINSLERKSNKVEPKTLFSLGQPENGVLQVPEELQHADPLAGRSQQEELLSGYESSFDDSDYLADLKEPKESVPLRLRAKKKTEKAKTTKSPEKKDSPTTTCAQTKHRKSAPSPTAASLPTKEPGPSRDSSLTASDDSSASLNSGYSFKSSAYVQSLAEICHAISWDRRWRVGPQQQRLFAWERGDDLSVVHALAKMYEPLPPLPPPSNCACLLCRDAKTAAKDRDQDQDATKFDAPSNESHLSLTSSTNNEEEERSLNLYCRLFSRKGPWFRVDDIFKYYVPKETPAALSQESPSESPNNAASSPSKFFQPRATNVNKPKTNKSIEAMIDQQLVERHIECLALLLNDLDRLRRMGLIRSFQDEEECGKTVGQVQKYGLLRMEEQRQILAKLGGSKRKAASNNGRTSTTPSDDNGNQIWKQMCQQQSISCLAAASDQPVRSTKATLLPVSKHVDQAILHSLVTSIVLKSSRQEYVPASILREASAAVKEIVEPLLANCGDCRIHTDISIMCLRLREAPAQTLRRFSRLYLCATSGPGGMRGDGTNGWRSLPECHSKDLSNLPLVTNMVPPPGSHSWHSVSYPGRDYRFKLISCNFMRAHQPLVVSNEHTEVSLKDQVFPNVDSFHIWEQCVELRANVDYLLELNDLLLYNERRRARDNTEEPPEEKADEGEGPDEAPDDGDKLSTAENSETSTSSQVDFLDLLTLSGRRKLLENFQIHTTMKRLEFDAICSRIEGDLAIFCDPRLCRLKNECEDVLAVTAVLAIHILESRNQTASTEELSSIAARPWLRHLWWEGCLAYLLWDIIPVLERRGYYAIAVKALEVLLLGRTKTNGEKSTNISSIVPETLLQSERENEAFLSQFFLSRRARGKAYERLILDYVHLLRRKAKEEAIISASKDPPKKRAKRSTTTKDAVKTPTPNDITGQLCRELLACYVSTGQITFSAARTLARRLKQPLVKTLAHLDSFEARELGHRLDNEEGMLQISEGDSTEMKKYSDWTPKTDQAVANALAGEDTMVGRRCSFIGFEDRDKDTLDRSLNVEQLAMEYYRTGRLPSEDDGSVRGGWDGWHDEGGRVRALFRVISSASILGMDWGCFYEKMENAPAEDLATIHLTPYQGAPFDLHVGAELQSDEMPESNARSGFYQRRRQPINKLLARLNNLEPQGCSDLVYESVAARLEYAVLTKRNDPTLERDVQQVRTLSMLAAGLGGKQLSAIFRCFFFDYRHYSGGLPDCTLVRALYSGGEAQPEDSLVDLGDWVGEGFSPEHLAVQEAQRAASIFEDRDEEFLGCSKVGDSGGRAMNRFSRSGGRQTPSGSEQSNKEVVLELPPILLLNHNSRPIQVECMLVEVKSQNDRLDPRQEDWLNVLDRHGNARVCKFGKPKTNRKKGKENVKRQGTTS